MVDQNENNLKTPLFDEALDKVLSLLDSGSRKCVMCDNDFLLSKEDIIFLKMLRVPPPQFCSNCRNMRRLSFANYSNIYKRKCDVSGHNDIMISPVPPVMPWVTYDYDAYYKGSWSPYDYGTPVDFSKNFFEQYLSILKDIPQPGVRRGSDSPNSDYSFYGKFMKDCYYVFGGRHSEDIMYSASIYKSKKIVDSYYTMEVDIGYENIFTDSCSKCFYTYFSSNCIDSYFLYDCRNCQDCFSCVNLRNKKYCWFNEQLSREEYQKRLKEVGLGQRSAMLENKNLFFDFVKSQPIRAERIQNSSNVYGNEIKDSKNCYSVYMAENSDNIRYCNFAIMYMKNSMDTNHSGRGDHLYECQNTGNSSNVKFSFAVKETIDSEYLMTCTNCQNCFGCVGLTNASYCIFNKQYSKEEYFKKLDEIKLKMLNDGLYGEFFPFSFSPIAYNSSFAYIIYHKSKNEAEKQGSFWQEEIMTNVDHLNILEINNLPDSINDFDIQNCAGVFLGEGDTKPYKITEREVLFYKQYNIPIPNKSPYQRMLNRFKLLNNFQSVSEKCSSCGESILSPYKSSDGFIPYCDKCYKKAFI